MFHLIVNPIAGKKKKSLARLLDVERVFKENQIDYAVHQTRTKGDGEEIVKRLTGEGETDMIVVGGDGTLHEVLNGLADPSVCRLGLIPSGTGNDFAYSANIPLNAEEAAKIIVKGETKETDYIEVDGRRSMNVCGLGMDVDVLERCSRGRMKGKLKYVKSLVSSLFAFKGYKVKVENEERSEEHDSLIACVCNGKAFGGGIKICPVAEIDDGKLDVMLVDCIGGKLKLIKAFLTLMKGKIMSYPLVTHFLADKITFVPKAPTTIQLDGELYKNLRFEAKSCKGLKVFR